jgi:NAD+ dependent glucose-6-phosphate dehydrogenase
MPKKKVVLTGASGTIAGVLLPALREQYDLVLLDTSKTNRAGEEVAEVEIVDLLNPDRDTYRQYFAGADAVIHCAYYRIDNQGEAVRFSSELQNLQLTYNVYHVALEENVQRVVTASTNHAADFYEQYLLKGTQTMITPDHVGSDNWYGWGKLSFEQIGLFFAAGEIYDRQLENVQIRIGGPRETDVENVPLGNIERMRRALAVYISQHDMAQLFIKSIETEDIRDEFGVPFQIFYGISDNHHAFWSIANARKIIGYEPQDNSELRFHEQIQAHIKAYKEQNET